MLLKVCFNKGIKWITDIVYLQTKPKVELEDKSKIVAEINTKS